ncbi:MAG: RICIN domain-containing protein, partial [Blautia sp.]|nr:RICIN domain-containing protein [Blautia sp.]
MNYLTRKKYFNMILLFSMIGLFLIIRVNWISSVKAATFAEAIDSFTTGTVGKKASDLGLPSGENWCGYYARYVLENVYAQYGCDVNDYIPYDSLASTTLTGNTWKNGVYGEYYSWTNWTYSGRSSSITSNLSACRPKAGDIVLVETAGGISDGPDHIALIVEADLNGNRFITAEGNTGSGTTSTRVVRWYDYVYNNDSGYYCRDGNSNIIVHAICSIRYPGNQGNQGNQSNQGHSPVGHVDSVSCEDGKICLAGWAFDEDAYYENLQIIVNIDYIEEYILEANGYRPDVNEAYQNVPGVNHGFEGEIYPAQRGLKNVVIYAVDMGGNSVCDNTILWEGPLEIKDDTTPPTIEDVYIHDIDANGYYIHCIVRDNVGLREVEFPTWTLENKNASGDDQDDIIWGNAGTVSGNGWELDYRVNYSDHKNELDCTYATHIYCYDMSGNEGIYAISQYACNGSVMTSGYGRVIPDGDYIVATACSGSKADLYYLDIVGTDLPANDGTNVALAGPISTLEDPQSYDVWTLTYGSDGFYSIKQKGSEVSLDVANASAGSGANIQAYNSNSSNAQRWAISNNGRDGYRIQGKCSGLSIVAEDNRAAGGTNIHQYINMDIPGESWLFIPYKPSQPIANGRYMLISGLSDSVEVDVPGDTGDITENLGLQIWSTDTQNQYNSFNLTKLSNGFYKIQHAASGKCWDVTNGVSSFSQQIALHTDNGSIAQQWAIISKGNNLYAIISRCNGLTADVHGGTTSNGTRIIQFPNGEGSNQRWKFVQAEYTVAFNANGGAGVPASQTKYYNNNLTLSSTKPTLTGYTFQSWNTKADGTGTNYAAGGSYTTNADVTLYAMWKKQDEEPPIITGGNLEILSDTLCRFTVTATDNIGIDHVDIHTWYGDYSGSGD